MLTSRPASVRAARRLAAAFAAFSVLTACTATAAFAAPAVDAAPPTDAVLRLLAERGLVDNAPSTAETPRDAAFVARVRDKASDMVLTAMNFLGVPYQRGGADADRGFDCSGFTRHIFEMSLGLVLPRRAEQQATTAGLLRVTRDELRPGDLVFFNTMKRTFSHVGIYLGEGRFIHSPKPGGEVRVDDMRTAYWDHRFSGARRPDPVALPTPPDAAPPRLN